MITLSKPRLISPLIGLSLLLAGCVQTRYLTQDPPAGGLRHNEVVLVDDGSCPAGQVKQLTGGHMA